MELQEIIQRFPGISCACLDAAGRVATECYGLADRERGIPVDANTIFPAASISKFVTAICLMKLHEEKIIDIDAPANQYLQQWKLRKADGTESDATISAIMCHTAGIVDGENSFYGLRHGNPEISLMDILEGRTFYNNRPVRAEKPHGAAFEYSDAGYCVLQLLIEEITHKAFEDALQEVERCMFAAADQPLLTADTVTSLALAAKNGSEFIWRTVFENEPGNPVVFPNWTFQELKNLPEGKGGNVVVKNTPKNCLQFQPVTDMNFGTWTVRKIWKNCFRSYKVFFC